MLTDYSNDFLLIVGLCVFKSVCVFRMQRACPPIPQYDCESYERFLKIQYWESLLKMFKICF
jgi:hypothetical protein